VKLPNAVPKPRAKRKPSGPQPLKRSRLKARGKRSKKSGGQLFHGAKFRDPQYLEWVRAQSCVIRERPEVGAHCVMCREHHVCENRIQACHVRSRGAGGVDRGNVVPMCGNAHHEQHRIGLPAFQQRWGIDLRAEALRLQALYESEHPHES